jgi:glycosyltransferase involved in cell wall biosynthesis
MQFTFAVSTNNKEILQNNLMASPCFRGPHPHQILVQESFHSAAAAHNDALRKAVNDIIVFVHQDILFPEAWVSQFEHSLEILKERDPNWGVLGCYGETLDDGGRGYVYSGGVGILGKPFDLPAPVQTLDEIVLVLRVSSGLKFDELLPNFHFYGADICMQAAAKGLNNYAISAFCIHNTQLNLILPKEFYESYRYVKRKWKNSLPIQTTCVRLAKSDRYMYMRRIREAWLRITGRNSVGASRAMDGAALLAEFDSASRDVVDLEYKSGGYASK